MMTLDADNAAALAAQQLLIREFIWFTVRDRSTGDPVEIGYWSDFDTITASVYNPDTGTAESREWLGASDLIQISLIARVADLSAQSVDIVLRGVSDNVDNLLRTYDPRQGKVEIYRGFCDPDTRQLVAPAEPRFLGFIDDVEMPLGREGEEANVTVKCRSHSSELARSNMDVRSDASQRRRSATDNFFEDVTTVGEWVLFWGQQQGTVETVQTPTLPWLNAGKA